MLCAISYDYHRLQKSEKPAKFAGFPSALWRLERTQRDAVRGVALVDEICDRICAGCDFRDARDAGSLVEHSGVERAVGCDRYEADLRAELKRSGRHRRAGRVDRDVAVVIRRAGGVEISSMVNGDGRAARSLEGKVNGIRRTGRDAEDVNRVVLRR